MTATPKTIFDLYFFPPPKPELTGPLSGECNVTSAVLSTQEVITTGNQHG